MFQDLPLPVVATVVYTGSDTGHCEPNLESLLIILCNVIAAITTRQ